MELGLELMTIVGLRLADPEGKPGNDVFDERDRIGLSVPVVDPERPDAGRNPVGPAYQRLPANPGPTGGR